MFTIIYSLKTWFGGSKRFSKELIDGQYSTVIYRVRWSRRLMKITDKMALSKPVQTKIYEVGIQYYKEQQMLRFRFPHLPDVLEQESKIIRAQRDSHWGEILGERYGEFKVLYKKYHI